GMLTIDGTTVQKVDLTVDMASVSSDKDRRDNQFRGRIMNVATYPTATFVLAKPIQLPRVPNDTSIVEATATGKLTLHGTTKTVTVPLKARRNRSTLVVNGTIPITFDDYGIPNP